MKRIFAILMAAFISITIAACDDNNKKETSNNTSTSLSSSSQISENSEIVLSDLKIPENAGRLLKAGLKDFLVNLDEDEYRLHINMSTSNGNPKIVIITRSNDNITAATGESEAKLNKTVVKDKKCYLIDDKNKTVTWADYESDYAEGYTNYLAGLFYITNIEMIKTDKEKFGDKEMDFEEYKIIINDTSNISNSSLESSNIEEQYVRYYFNDGKFSGMKIINGNGYYSLHVASLTHEIPKDEFDIPSDYKLVEAETSETVSSKDKDLSQTPVESLATSSKS